MRTSQICSRSQSKNVTGPGIEPATPASLSGLAEHICGDWTVLSFEPRHEKTNVLVSDLVRHKPGCKATEDGYRLEISDLESRGIVLSTIM